MEPPRHSSYASALLNGVLGNKRLEENKNKAKGDDGFEKKNGGLEEGNGESEKYSLVSEGMESGLRVQYPVRPNKPSCLYYLRTGCCGYGALCKFNHPPDWKPNQVPKENTEILGLIDCKYHSMPGGCRNGDACKYYHHPDKDETAQVELNSFGLPLRPGERVCSFYMHNGICKYSSSCIFHHPETTAVPGALLSGYENGRSPQAPGSDASSVPDTSRSSSSNTSEFVYTFDASEYYVADILPQSLQQDPELNSHQVSAASSASSSSGCNAQHSSDPTSSCPTKIAESFMQLCIDHLSKASDISPFGLPMRSDQPVCIYYKRYGICKNGYSCKFDHPLCYALFPVPESAESSESQISSIRTEDLKTRAHNSLIQQSA